MVFPRTQPAHAPRGITLLEVLIAMGILTIGLVSVAALVPAGRSQAMKAAIYDRSSTLAANAVADLVSRGFLRTEELMPAVPGPGGTFSQRILIYDPLATSLWGPASAFVTLRDDAATAASSPTQLAFVPLDVAGAAGVGIPAVAADIVFRSEDDPIFGVPDGDPDGLPLPDWTADSGASGNGRHAFDGTYSYLATLESGVQPPGPYWLSGRQATLTIAAFHRRDPNTPPFALRGTIDSSALWVDPDPTGAPVQLPDGDTIRDVVKPGSMVLWADDALAPTFFRWYRVLLVADESTTADGLQVSISCEGSDPPLFLVDPSDPGNSALWKPCQLYVLPGCVAGLQVPVTLEGSSQWSE
jgi:hypothetical protein